VGILYTAGAGASRLQVSATGIGDGCDDKISAGHGKQGHRYEGRLSLEQARTAMLNCESWHDSQTLKC
jgi:hypothetical protein